MKTTISYLLIISISFALLAWSSFSLAKDNPSTAESNALKYITAFFAIEIDEVVAITHPNTIDQLHEVFIAEMSRAEENGNLDGFLSEFGISLSVREIKELSKKDLYAFVVSSNNRRASKAALEHMKGTKFEVLRSELINEQTTIVTMSMGNPKPEKEFRLELKLENEEWLVVGDAS